jgi:hypothetical protein
MIRHLLFSAGCILLLGSSTCERPIALDITPPPPELVIISTFSPDRPFEVSVSSTRPALIPSQTEFISDAEVALFQEASFLEQFRFIPGSPGVRPFYRSGEYSPVPGTLYTVAISAPGYPSVKATGSVPQRVDVSSIEAVHHGFSIGNKPDELLHNYTISVIFDDPFAFRNYYHLRFHQEVLTYRFSEGDTVILSRRLQHISFGSGINNNTITAYLDDGVLFEDSSFNGRRVNFSFPIQTLIEPDRELLGQLYLELRTVSEDYYRFYSSVARQQENPGPPYTEPVIVYSNVEQGRGVFAGYHAAMDSTRIIR